MPTSITCPHCRTSLRVPEEYRGKKVRCKACEQTFTAAPEEELDEVQPVREEPRVQSTRGLG